MVWGLGFGVWGLGFGVWGLGFYEKGGSEEDGASGRMTRFTRPTGRCLRNVILPGAGYNFADHEATKLM